MMESGQYTEAIVIFRSMESYEDSKEKAQECMYGMFRHTSLVATNSFTVALRNNGSVKTVGHWSGMYDVFEWRDIVAVAAGGSHTVGLRSDGTVVAVGNNGNGQCRVTGLTNIRMPE